MGGGGAHSKFKHSLGKHIRVQHKFRGKHCDSAEYAVIHSQDSVLCQLPTRVHFVLKEPDYTCTKHKVQMSGLFINNKREYNQLYRPFYYHDISGAQLLFLQVFKSTFLKSPFQLWFRIDLVHEVIDSRGQWCRVAPPFITQSLQTRQRASIIPAGGRKFLAK